MSHNSDHIRRNDGQTPRSHRNPVHVIPFADQMLHQIHPTFSQLCLTILLAVRKSTQSFQARHIDRAIRGPLAIHQLQWPYASQPIIRGPTASTYPHNLQIRQHPQRVAQFLHRSVVPQIVVADDDPTICDKAGVRLDVCMHGVISLFISALVVVFERVIGGIYIVLVLHSDSPSRPHRGRFVS